MVHFYSLRYLIATNEAQTKKADLRPLQTVDKVAKARLVARDEAQTKKRTCVRFLFFSYAKYLLRSPSNALPCLAFSVITRYETVPRTVSPKFILNLEPRGKGRSTNKKADLRPLFILFLCEISFKKALKCFTVSCFVPCHFMYSIVDCIKTLFFSKLCKLCFTESCTVFCCCSHFKIFLC